MITAEQIEFKKGKVGSSQAAAAVGVSPWQTPADLAAEILGLKEPKEIPETANELGNKIEPLLAAEYERLTGRNPVRQEETVTDRRSPNFIAHLDFVVYPKIHSERLRVLEIKTVGPRLAYRWGSTGDCEDVPAYVVAQILHQCMCFGINRVDVAAYFGGGDFRYWEFVFTDQQIAGYRKKLDAFWAHIERKELPEFTGKDLGLLQSLYGVQPGKVVEAQNGLADAARDLAKVKALIKRLENDRDAAEARIKGAMKGADTLVDAKGNVLATWKQSKDTEKIDWRGAFDEVCAIEDIDGDVREDFIRLNTQTKPGSRRFLCKVKEANNG